MNTIKIFSFFLLSLFISTTSFGQSEKVIEKVNMELEKLNEQLAAAGEEYILTELQTKQAYSIYADGFTKMQENWKAKIDKEEKKALNKPIRKEMNKAIRKEVLTKEQRKAISTKK